MDATREARRPRAPGADLPPGVCRYCTKPTGSKQVRAHEPCRKKWRTVNVPAEVRDYIFNRDHYRCIDCGRRSRPHPESELEVDHDQELADGGKNDPRNLLTRCLDHHAAKTQERRMARTATATPTAAKGKVKPPVTGDLPDAPQPPWGFIVGVAVVTALGWLALDQVDPARASRPLLIGTAVLLATFAVSAWRLFRWHRARESKRVYDRLCKQAGTAYAQRKVRWKVLAWSWITPTSVRLTYGDDFKDADPGARAQLVETFARAIDVDPAHVAHKVARGRITMTYTGERAPARADDAAPDPEPARIETEDEKVTRIGDALGGVLDDAPLKVTVRQWWDDGAPARIEVCYPSRVKAKVGQNLERLIRTLGDAYPPQRDEWYLVRDKPRDLLLFEDRYDPLAQAPPLPPIERNPDLKAGVVIGVTEDGQPWRIPLLGGSHVLVAGASGSGKGSPLWDIIRALAYMIADERCRLWIIDPKGGAEFKIAKAFAYRYAVEDDDAIKLLAEACSMLSRKAAVMGDDDDADAQITEFTRETPFDLVIIDELAALTENADSKVVKAAIAYTGKIQKQGRAPAMTLIGATQEVRKTSIPNRSGYTTALALRLSEDIETNLALGRGARADGALADLISKDYPGIGYTVVDGKARFVRGRAAWGNQDAVKREVRAMILGLRAQHARPQVGEQLTLVKEDARAPRALDPAPEPENPPPAGRAPEPENPSPARIPTPGRKRRPDNLVDVGDLKDGMRVVFDGDPDPVTIVGDARKDREGRVVVTYRYDGETGVREADFDADDTAVLA